MQIGPTARADVLLPSRKGLSQGSQGHHAANPAYARRMRPVTLELEKFTGRRLGGAKPLGVLQ